MFPLVGDLWLARLVLAFASDVSICSLSFSFPPSPSSTFSL